VTRKRIVLAAWLAALALAAAIPLAAVFDGLVYVGQSDLVFAGAPAHPVVSFGRTIILAHGTHTLVIALGSDIKAHGNVTDDLLSAGGSVYLYPSARVRADVVTVMGVVYRARSSVVEGRLGGAVKHWNTRTSGGLAVWPMLWRGARLGFAAGLALLLIVSTVIIVFPWQVVQTATTLQQHPWRSTAFGVVNVFIFTFLAVPLGLSLAGLPFALLLTAGGFLAWLLGVAAIAVLAGRALSRSPRPLLPSAALGLVALSVLMIVPVIGPVAVLTCGLMGAGSLAVSIVERTSPARSVT